MINRFVFNETSYFGFAARSVLVNEIKKRKFKKALLVTDKELIKVGVTNKITDLLDANSISYEMFSDVSPNPTVNNVKKGFKIANKYHVDYIIAVGGGSVIDVAKAIGIICTNPGDKDIRDLVCYSDTDNKSLPIIAFPTTAGAASESTISYAIIDEDAKSKTLCNDPNNIPVLSIIDTELLDFMPASLAATTGLESLAQAMEAYISKEHNEMSDMFAIKAINLIYSNLERAVNKDKNAMENMALAQYVAGMAFSNSGLGIVHSMAHQLSATYGTSHGLASAVLLPYVLEYNGEKCEERFVDIAKAMGLEIDGLTKEEVVKLVVEAVRELSARLNIPEHLSEIGVIEKDIPSLSDRAYNDPCTIDNPRIVDITDLENLFKTAL